ncbi:hypothetical protein A3D81_01355 [Candidatus Curtissbacteria bacterium RIFCSPHIGHO2_02_FULL_40_17]|uniref:Glycosyltransferase RgtA/B/C/D-like domain-containing protein n=2 Tax=Candidatus Curtissiibacteriota TaxID=1752717 RepID=A0A1F5GHU5_9BACT|nr:MAG: hypothetical protein A3D81_01355 [Candidatus Curtissbacteria bacterium RIFCSPHIGHO2_02_FULL_40_17]OGE03341.1 MAG: hypothetical protein A3F45_03335 [Candidatus Curtissbacteria bacterium RIFCSPHIGHO2_12_FULL_41_17]
MIVVILVVSLILRLISINQSLWLDEGINVNVARNLNVKSLIFDYSLSDFHPPLFHVLLRGWILLFGSSEIAVRSLSVILAVATIFVIYLIARKLFENKTALISATLLATSPLHIYYSQEARMYMLAAFLASLSVYFFISLFKKDNIWYWTGFIVSTALMLYSDYLPYLLIPAYIIYLLLVRKKIEASTVKAFIPSFIIIALLTAPWLYLFPKQLNIGLSAAAASPAWAQVVGSPQAKNLLLVFVKFVIGRISLDNNLIYAFSFAPIAVYVTSLFVLSLFRISYLRSFLWFWFLLPILSAFILSFFVPVFSYFRFIYILGAFYIILASAINTINWTPLVRFLLGIFLIINLVSTGIYFAYPKFQRENWRDATNFVVSSSNNKTLILFAAEYTTGPFDYYNQDRIKAVGALLETSAEPSRVKKRVELLTKDINKVFLFQYLSQITDPQGIVFQELTKQGFTNTKTNDFQGVGFIYEFTK